MQRENTGPDHQMAVTKTGDDVETHGIPVGTHGIPVGSAPPDRVSAETRAIGYPWNSGLFDCNEHQTNAEMGRIDASELNGGQSMAQPVAMPMISPQPEFGNNPGGFYPGHAPVDGFVKGRPWNTGVFDCHENIPNAVMTAFCPCVTFGQIAEVMDKGEMTCPLGSFLYLVMMPAFCTHWLMGSKYRAKLRREYNLVEAPYSDIVSHIFCPCCSLCQEFRELQSRGLNPALGWNGIQAQQQTGQNQAQELSAPPGQAMYK